jgi:hypothetical protein
MAKGNDQERRGELEWTMRTIMLCCKRHEVHTKTEIVSQSKEEVNGNHD